VPALPSSVLEPLWVQVAALRPARQDPHPLGCHRRRIPTGWGSTSSSRCWCSAAATGASPSHLLGDHPASPPGCVAQRRGGRAAAPGWCWPPPTSCSAGVEHLAVDGCTTKAPCGGQVAGPSPVDRRKQGWQRSLVTDAGGIPLGRCQPGPPPRRRAAGGHLGRHGVVGVLPERPVGTWTPAMTTEAAGRAGRAGHGRPARLRGLPAPVQASRRWPVERTTPGVTSTASCAGAPNAAESWSRSGWPWPPPRSWVAGCCAAPAAATAGTAAPAAGRDRLLAQALSLRFNPWCRPRGWVAGGW
jgi:hypothetical protein